MKYLVLQSLLLIFLFYSSIFSSLLFKYLFLFICLSFFYFLQFFFKYSSSNFLSFYPYNSFAMYFPSSSPLLKSFSSAISIFYCLLTSIFILPLNSSNASLAFPKSFLFFHMLLFAINPFHCTRYLSTPLIFLLFNIFSTSHSLTSSTSIGFPSFFFCPPICSLYHTIQLTFTTK